MKQVSELDKYKKEYPDIPEEIWRMLNKSDPFTFNHSLRVCEMSKVVEQELRLPENKVLSEAGLLHDIGKYFYSHKILEKRGSLTEAERDVINTHAFLSYYTLMKFGISKAICEIVLYHHTLEPYLFDQKLQPCSDVRIEYFAKIIKTIDIFEAITSDRSYHRGLSERTAVQCFKDDNIDHDPAVLTILINNSKITRE